MTVMLKVNKKQKWQQQQQPQQQLQSKENKCEQTLLIVVSKQQV